MDKTWNSRCSRAVRKEKAEIAVRYGITFGQTTIFCSKCKKPVSDPLVHKCGLSRNLMPKIDPGANLTPKTGIDDMNPISPSCPSIFYRISR